MKNIPAKMKAFTLTGHGDMDQLVFRNDWPVPQPGSYDVLIKVHACGLNNTDVNSRTAWYSKGVTGATTGRATTSAQSEDAAWGGTALKFPRIQGADVCGTVSFAGDRVPEHLLDKRVMIEPWIRDWRHPDDLNMCGYLGSESDGGFAEFVCVDYRQVHPVESDLSHVEIATFATSWLTAENMLDQAGVQTGDTVLITGASGGVGSALIQLANRRNATTIALATESKHAQLKPFCPDVLLGRAPENLKSELKNAIGKETVTVIADVVGGDYWPDLIAVLARRGRYAVSGAIAGPVVPIDLRTLYLNDLRFFGCTVVPRGTFARLVQYIENAEISPIIGDVFPLEALQDAQQRLIDKQHVGNIVVTVDS